MPLRSHGARRSAALALVCTLVLAACATVAPRIANVPVLHDAAFAIDGRLSARRAGDAVSASFEWRHAPPRDELTLSTPLGQVVAQLSGDAAAHVARVRLGDGRTLEAPDWPSLTQRALGFPLPVEGLSAWIRAGAHEGTPYRAEVDAQGRATVLRQDGWELVYDYPDERAKRPSRIRMTFPDVEVRIAIDRFD